MNEQPDNASLTTVSGAEARPRIDWQWSAFDGLSLTELYTLLQVREMVFIVEQSCLYLDADGFDEKAWHLLGWTQDAEGKTLAAYARIFAPGIKYREAAIGRVMTHPSLRGKGLGEALMAEALRRVELIAPAAPVRVGAQMHLERFYEKSGFRRASEPYDEDGIIHIEMLRAG